MYQMDDIVLCTILNKDSVLFNLIMKRLSTYGLYLKSELYSEVGFNTDLSVNMNESH